MGLTIIGGAFKGRLLRVPKTARPTSALIRKSLFDIWREEIDGASFLDLCAGSGAMGIEALSRGARSATFVDISPKAIKQIQLNLETLGSKESARLMRAAALSALQRLAKEKERFDLIFIDPPYDLNPLPLLEALDEMPLLTPTGIIALETSKQHTTKKALSHLTPSDERRFGDTTVTFYRSCSTQ